MNNIHEMKLKDELIPSDEIEIKTIHDYLSYIESHYSDRVAFESVFRQWTYKEFVNRVYHASGFFIPYQRKTIRIEISDPYLFSLIFFSTILSGNIAAITPRLEMNNVDYTKSDVFIDDALATEILEREYEINIIDTEPKDCCMIVYSSGTTNERKEVMLSQDNLLSDMIAISQLFIFETGAVYVNLLPFEHMFGLMADLLLVLLSGGKLCFPQTKMLWMQSLRIYRPTQLNLPPAAIYQLGSLLQIGDDYDYITGGKLKKIISSGAPLKSTYYSIFQRYGITIYNAYGLTECSPCVSINSEKNYRVGSVGKVLPCCDVRIDNGEIAVRGRNVMLGYLGDEEATSRTIRNNWLYTGDMGYLDEGFLFLTGRKSNLLVFSNGKKVFSEEIESEMDNIKDVIETRVKKVNAEDALEIELVICDKADEQSILEEATALIVHLIPKGIRFRFVLTNHALARTDLGKIIRL